MCLPGVKSSRKEGHEWKVRVAIYVLGSSAPQAKTLERFDTIFKQKDESQFCEIAEKVGIIYESYCLLRPSKRFAQ